MENKIGVCDFSFPCGGVLGIEMAGKAGYQGLQIADATGLDQGAPLLSPYVREPYMEAAAKYGMEFQGLNLSTLCFANVMGSPLDSPRGQLIQNNLKNNAKVCELMGIKMVMLNVNNIHFIAKPSPEIMKNIMETLRFANNLFEEIGVTISVETCIPAPMLHKIREEISENIKMCFDIGNPVFHGIGEPWKLIEEYGVECIDHFHIKDFKKGYFGYLTQNPEMCYPGEGAAGLEKCAEVIKKGGYKGWFISESIYTNPNFYDDLSNGMDYVAAGKKDLAIIRKAFCE